MCGAGVNRTVAHLPSAICNLLGVCVNLSALASRKANLAAGNLAAANLAAANLAAAAATFCSLHFSKMRRRGRISAALVPRR